MENGNTEYGGLLCKSLYSVQVRENIDQKNLRICILHTVIAFTVQETSENLATFCRGCPVITTTSKTSLNY